MEVYREHARAFLPALQITYSRVSTLEGYEKVTRYEVKADATEWIIQRTKASLLSYVLGDAEDEATAKDVQRPVTRFSANCIISGLLPIPVVSSTPSDSSDSIDFSSDLSVSIDSNEEPACGRKATSKRERRNEKRKIEKDHHKLLPGLAYSNFYNGSFSVAMKDLEYYNVMRKGRPCENSLFLQLESAVYLGKADVDILADLRRIELCYPERVDKSAIRILLRLAFEMHLNQRHYGVILACRLTSFLYRQLKKEDNTSVFRFLYTMIFEMSLRAVDVRGKSWEGNKLVILCMRDVVREMDVIQKRILRSRDCDQTLGTAVGVKMLAECRNAIAFCCNSVGMYKTADKIGTSKGMRKIERYPDGSLRQRKIYGDLMVNKGISLLGRGMSNQAIYYFKLAINQYENCNNLTTEEKNERHERANKNLAAAVKLSHHVM